MNLLEYIESHWGIILTVVGFLVSIAFTKLDARYARTKDVKEDFAKVDEKHTDIEHRVDKVEQAMAHLPSAEDVMDLRVAIKDMQGETRELHATTKALNRVVHLLLETEVKEKKQ